MYNNSISIWAEKLRKREVSSAELTQFFLKRIEKLDPQYNSFITTCNEQALAQANAADALLAKGDAPALCGIPIAHKDIFCTRGVLTTCGSKMLANFVPPYNATSVENFARAGTVTLGKTNMDEFAMGSSNETSFFGPVKNPWDKECVAGGSSGGSAAAVAACLTPGATATDTGGSIRQPASLCGITGIKPTYGRVSRWGMIAFASSLDQGGVMARNAQDAALLLSTMASFDAKDSTSIERPVEDYSHTLNTSLEGLTIGVPDEYFGEGLNPETATTVQAAIAEIEKLGAKTKAIQLPHTKLAVPAYYVIAPAECSANLSRFDGVRYGYRAELKEGEGVEALYVRSRSEAFGDEVKRRIMVGAYALSAGYYDAYYAQAQKARRLIQQDFVEAFKEVDLIMGPTAPNPAFKIGAKGNDPVAMYLEDIFTIATNLAGLPGMSIPCGFVDNKPCGLQIIGNYFAEGRMLNAAHQFQCATDFHSFEPADIA